MLTRNYKGNDKLANGYHTTHLTPYHSRDSTPNSLKGVLSNPMNYS